MNVYVNKRLNSIKAIVILQKMTSMWISFTISLWTFWSGISWLSMEGQKAFRFYQKYLQWRDRKLSDFIKNILISVLKMNESLTVLERHDGE